MERPDFRDALTSAVRASLDRFYGADNWDEARYGPRGFVRGHALDLIGPPANRLLQRLPFGPFSAADVQQRLDEMLSTHGGGLAETYALLADDYSRRAFVSVLAYRVAGYRHVKLWTNSPAYRDALSRASGLPADGESIRSSAGSMPLRRMDLHAVGYPLSMYTHAPAIAHQFLQKQYAYEERNPPIWISRGDVVIDGGAAWGDTALLFAYAAGASGRVVAFEFEPANLEILRKNMALNPDLAARITTVSRALWRDSATTLHFTPGGTGTRVVDAGPDNALEVASISIDEYAQGLPRVDFIKMDIEGAETAALEGAAETIRRHRPKLAISLYHSLSDFVDIPRFIASLGVPYEYYIDHATIHAEETVLFAR